MPLSRAPRRPDLERVVQVLGGGVAQEGAKAQSGGRGGADRRAGWLPSRPGDERADASPLGWRGGGMVGGPADETDGGVDGLARNGAGGGARNGAGAGAGDGADGGADDGLEGLDRLLDRDLRKARRPGLVSVPAAIRTGRIAVSSSAVVAVLALVVALGCAFVVRILWAERAASGVERQPAASTTVEVASRSAPATGLTAPSDAQATATNVANAATGGGQPLVVHVVGQVKKPGLVRLAPGARVADAIAAAGGQTSKANLTELNLARPVVDGEQLLVPKPGQALPGSAPPGALGGAGAAAGGAGGASGTTAAGGAAGGGPGLVNLNTADLAALDTLPGVGPVLAQRILDWRAEHGRFTTVEELGEVSGIGDKMLSQLRSKVTV